MDTQSRFMQFDPPLLLRSPHMQTLLSSRLVRGFSSAAQALLERAETIIVPCRDGVRLQALANLDFPDAPMVIVVHGWLGRADSPYVRRTADALHGAGFNVARLLLTLLREAVGVLLSDAGLVPRSFAAVSIVASVSVLAQTEALRINFGI